MSDQPQEGGIGKFLLLGLLFICLLVVFTLVKVPQPKIHAWVLGTINQQLTPMGIQVSADEGHIQLGLGIKYEMSGVRLTKSVSQKSLRLSRMEVTPTFLPLLQGKLGGGFRLEDEGSGSVSGTVLTKSEDFEAKVDIENLDLGKMGILPFAAGIEGTSNVKGAIELAGNMSSLSSLSGKVDLNLAKLVIDSQKVMGFEVPRTAVGDGVISLSIGSGKVTFTTFRLGKPGGADDLNGILSGEIKLNKVVDNSDANLKLKFGFADRYKQEKTISLLDSLLGQFKLPDGTFSMRFMGPLYGLQPTPDQ